MKTTNVYISNYFDYDVSSAMQYCRGGGKIIPITKGKINVFRTDNLIRSIRYAIESATEDDWFILAGNTTVSALVSAMVYEVFGKINLLMWDARDREYKPREITLDNNNDIEGNYAEVQ